MYIKRLATFHNCLNRQWEQRLIHTYGLTQGKSSSATMFSFDVSDMHAGLDKIGPIDYMDSFNLLQLADDTTIFAEGVVSFKRKAGEVIIYSEVKHLKINMSKTKYLRMSCDNTSTQESIIIDNICITQVKDSDGYNWLGFWLKNTNDVEELIQYNINKKMFKKSKKE